MPTIVFASDSPAERDALQAEPSMADFDILTATTRAEVERLFVESRADVVVTDLHFDGGTLVDLLLLWSYPSIFIVDWDDHDRIAALPMGQVSDFVVRDETMHHIQAIPHVIRKVLRIRESLERHNVDLKLNEQRYHELVQSLPDIVYALDASGNFVFVNNSVRRLGWEPGELVGRHFSHLLADGEAQRVGREWVLKDLQGVRTGQEASPKLFDERRSGDRRTRDLEIRLRRRLDAGHPRPTSGGGSEGAGEPADASRGPSEVIDTGVVISFGEINAVGLASFGGEGGTPGTVGIIRDITSQREARERLASGLREKETLLAEVHHRIKNNLQVISSLLALQSESIEVPAIVSAQSQIQAMALVHEHMYNSATLGNLNLPDYLTDLVAALMDALAVNPMVIRHRVVADDLSLPFAQVMPVALVLNELITNAITHGFTDGGRGQLTVEVRRTDGSQIAICVADTGVGMRTDETDEVPGRGLGLVRALAAQLNGVFDIRVGGGTTCTLTIPLLEE